MTTEEIEDVVRALITVVDNLETGSAKRSMQEAFMQVHAHASATRASAKVGPPGQRDGRTDLFLIKSEWALKKRASRPTIPRKASGGCCRSQGYVRREPSAFSLTEPHSIQFGAGGSGKIL